MLLEAWRIGSVVDDSERLTLKYPPWIAIHRGVGCSCRVIGAIGAKREDVDAGCT